MPHITFLGIQKDELNLFTDQISSIDNEAKQLVVPIISARIEAINDVNPKELIDERIKVIGLLTEKEEYLGLKILLPIIQLLKVNGGMKIKKVN